MTATLRPTNVLWDALQAVRDRQIVCHPPWSHHVPGWGWAGGGDITLPFQDALSDLHAAKLIEVDRSGRDHVDGDLVVVTAAGRDRVGAWQFWASRVKGK